MDRVTESFAFYSDGEPEKCRVGATIEISLRSLRDRLFFSQGLTACRFPDIPGDVEIRAVTFNPHRDMVTLLMVPTWSPAELPDPDNVIYSSNAGRFRLFWLHNTAVAPNQELRDERVSLDGETPDDVLLKLLQDPVVGPDLKALAANVVSLLLKEKTGE